MNRFLDWLMPKRGSKGHRTTAANCRFWIGDNDSVDWDVCERCPR